jgi:methionine synthase II (cobalamin-independent)
MTYDPRTTTGIPTEPVGSIPRPQKLQQAFADYDAKKIAKAQLEQEQDAAVADTLKRFEATGSPIISDGEQRVSSFATYPIADTLAGSGLAPNLAPGGQYFAIFADGHNRQLPKVTGGPFRYNFYAGELVKKAVKMTSKPLHQAVIAPSMMYLLYPLDGDLPGYSRKQFEDDIVNECEKDIRSCFAAGAAHVVMDFTEGRLASRNDPRNPWTTRNLLPYFIELDNRVFDRFSADERKNIGVHVCPGGDVDSVHSADVPYEELLKHLFKLNAGYFQMQMASDAIERQPTSWSEST